MQLLEIQALNIAQGNLTTGMIQKLSVEVPLIKNTITHELDDIRAIAESVSNTEAQSNMTLSISSTAQSAVDSLLPKFEQMEFADPLAITLVEELLASVSSELTSANIDNVVSTLRLQVVQQAQQKIELEAIINNLEEQADYLEQLHSTLPSDCTYMRS